jgi:hypothetical protein
LFRLLIAVALIAAGVWLSQQVQLSGLPINSSLTVPVWTIFVFFGWLVFQYSVWSDSWREFTSPMKIVLKTDNTPFQVFLGSVNSCAMAFIGGGVLLIIGLSATGHSDVAVQILQMVSQKLIRVIEALLS